MSPEIAMPLGASSLTSGLLPSIHLSSATLPSGVTFEMKPLSSAPPGSPLMFATRYTSAAASYRIDSGVANPPSLTTMRLSAGAAGGGGGGAGAGAGTGAAAAAAAAAGVLPVAPCGGSFFLLSQPAAATARKLEQTIAKVRVSVMGPDST